MVLIPAGSFTMGDPFTEGYSYERPTHIVSVSACYMDQYEVPKTLWDEVKNWAVMNGYSFDNAGSSKATNHPVHTVSWYDCVKWCNARSEKGGRVPAYYTEAAQTNVYRTGTNDMQNGWVKWTAGYRLPTEAEWEKAARGGLNGQRFPWGAIISETNANYYGNTNNSYDLGPDGYNAIGLIGEYPYTSPVGSFAPNGYGLYDMAGNVWEWCWDWYDESWYGNVGATQDNTRGPAGALSNRVQRGGEFNDGAFHARCAIRGGSFPSWALITVGFRCVRGPQFFVFALLSGGGDCQWLGHASVSPPHDS